MNISLRLNPDLLNMMHVDEVSAEIAETVKSQLTLSAAASITTDVVFVASLFHLTGTVVSANICRLPIGTL